LRAESGEADSALAEWWTRYQEADDNDRSQMSKPADKSRRRRRRRKKPASVE